MWTRKKWPSCDVLGLGGKLRFCVSSQIRLRNGSMNDVLSFVADNVALLISSQSIPFKPIEPIMTLTIHRFLIPWKFHDGIPAWDWTFSRLSGHSRFCSQKYSGQLVPCRQPDLGSTPSDPKARQKHRGMISDCFATSCRSTLRASNQQYGCFSWRWFNAAVVYLWSIFQSIR
jgi:hypothetical protein